MTILKNQLETYEVRVGDCFLKLKSRQDPDTFKEIEKVVGEQVRSSRRQYQTLPMQKTLALSCLNMAGELVCLKKALSRYLDRLESATQSLTGKIKSSSENLQK